METNKKTLIKVPIVDLQKKYDGRAFNMQINNTGDQPVRVRLFGNGQTFAEVIDEQEQGGETENYVKSLTELPASMNYDDVFVWTGDGDNGMVPGAMYVNRGTGEVVPIPSDVIFVWNGKSLQSYWTEEELQEFLSQLYGRIIFVSETGVFYKVNKYEWEGDEGEIISHYETSPIPANNQVVHVSSLGELVSRKFSDGQIIHYACHTVVDNENLKPGYNNVYQELLIRNMSGFEFEIVGVVGNRPFRGTFSAAGKEGICDGANCTISGNDGGYEWSIKLRIPFKEYDTEYDGVSYLCFGSANYLFPSYYIPENVVLGDEVTIYRYSQVLDGLNPEQPLVCTVTGDKSTWRFEGCITRYVDIQRNLSFPFDFTTLMMKINGSWVWMFNTTDGNGLLHAQNVVYEGDDMPSGLFFRSTRALQDYNEVLWRNIRIGHSVANVRVTGDYVQNIVIDDGVANITIESGTAGDAENWLQNIHVLSGDYEDNDQPSVVTIDRARNYKTTVGLTSLGQVATKNLMD